MNTKTAEEKPDFEALARKAYAVVYDNENTVGKQPIAMQHACKYGMEEIWKKYGMEEIWNTHVTPLKKRIEELEAALKLSKTIMDSTSEGIETVLKHPSTNGKQD